MKGKNLIRCAGLNIKVTLPKLFLDMVSSSREDKSKLFGVTFSLTFRLILKYILA